MDSCKLGQRVVLASGGPRMTVVRVSADGEMVECVWFSAAGEKQHWEFDRRALRSAAE